MKSDLVRWGEIIPSSGDLFASRSERGKKQCCPLGRHTPRSFLYMGTSADSRSFPSCPARGIYPSNLATLLNFRTRFPVNVINAETTSHGYHDVFQTYCSLLLSIMTLLEAGLDNFLMKICHLFVSKHETSVWNCKISLTFLTEYVAGIHNHMLKAWSKFAIISISKVTY